MRRQTSSASIDLAVPGGPMTSTCCPARSPIRAPSISSARSRKSWRSSSRMVRSRSRGDGTQRGYGPSLRVAPRARRPGAPTDPLAFAYPVGYVKRHAAQGERRARPDLRSARGSDAPHADRAHRPQAASGGRSVPGTVDLAAGGVEAPARAARRGARRVGRARARDGLPAVADVARDGGRTRLPRARERALGPRLAGLQGLRGAGGTGMTVRKSIHVKRSVEDSFRLFTQDIGKWWPLKEGFSFGGERADQIHLE